MPWRWKRIEAIWAAERLGSSRRSVAASSNSSGCARTVPVSERVCGLSECQPVVRRLGDDGPAVQGNRFVVWSFHVVSFVS
jgi:hypothetical protein